MLQPFELAQATLGIFREYVRASFPLRDEKLDLEREELIDQGLLWAEPFVSLARPGTTGPKLASLGSFLDQRTLEVPWGFADLYAHQQQAIERLASTRSSGPANTLILSGTGSGKTESFLIPIVDHCLRTPGPGIKAIVIYPMNALANDQLKRLRELLTLTPDVTFGRYTGDAPETDAGDSRRQARPRDLPPNMLWSRQAMRATPPNILLTNYSQLEYMLLRGKDAELFRYGPPRYFVVDEIHLFTGVLGAEVGCLLRRFRQHVGAKPLDICAVGTSATAGAGELPKLLGFAERLFGAPFGEEGAIVETPAPFRVGGSETPSTPDLSREDLAGASDVAGMVELAKKVFGVDLAADASFGEALGGVIDRFATVSVVERALAEPAPIRAAADALGKLAEREGVDAEALEREAIAILLLGSAAQQKPVGEEDSVPRFRPRLHQVVRSLSGMWRCLKLTCGKLLPPGVGICPECGSSTRPVATCRTCGEAYWTGKVLTRNLEDIDRIPAVEAQKNEPVIFLADPVQLPDPVDEDEEGNKVRWDRLTICPSCTVILRRPGGHDPACPIPTSQGLTYLGSTDNVHCPSCGDLGARDRPILLPLKGSAAASVAVLTQGLSDELRKREGEPGGRLLVFADSRQDAAQQAGYADDQGARVAVRQLIRQAIEARPLQLSATIKSVQSAVADDPPTLKRWLIGESERRFAEVADPDYQPSEPDEKRIRYQLEWEVALEFTERSRRRFSLEREGLITTRIDRLEEIVAVATKGWDGHPFGSQDRMTAVIEAIVDVMRYGRAVDHWMLSLSPKTLRKNHGVRVTDRAITATRGYAESKYKNAALGIDIRGWTAPKHVTRMSELVGRVLSKRPTEVNDVVEHLVSRLHASGLFTSKPIEKKKRVMVDHKRLLLSLRTDEQLWRCDRCGSVRSAVLTGLDGRPLCVNWRCPGAPQPFAPPAHRGFYRRQYEAQPRRLLVREHSGQVEADERLALEERFNDRSYPTIDVLACTPTLEVGVSLDDLNAILLRNLPPTPANYAQRVGRAGRRSKVAVAFGHAGQAPHDSYFFERPSELIAGLVRAPAISLDNEPLLRRHINSLILETLAIDLPVNWVPPIDDGEEFTEETVADGDGVIREETTLHPFEQKLEQPAVRRAVEEAVKGAFASSQDPAPPGDADRITGQQIDAFLPDLRDALNRWCNRYRALLDELSRIRRAKGVRSQAEKDMEDRLEEELRRMARPKSPEYQPLGFLGLVGFLPRYGFTGVSVLLHPPRGEEPIVQAASVAVTEFAPGNIVYARGRKLKASRLDPPPVLESEAGAEHRDNVLREGRRCDDCEFLTFDLLTKACPTCDKDLNAQKVVELTGIRGSGGSISSEDEFRSRSDYDVAYILGTPPDAPEIIRIGGLTFERSGGREITVANRGPRSKGEEERSQGFDVCTGCGYASESKEHEDDVDEEATETTGHAPRCPGQKDASGEVTKAGVWLTARIKGDALEILLPEATREAAFESWRVTLGEALEIGIRETMQAGPRDLGVFERQRSGNPWSVVIYDTMPGGTGYIPKLFADGGEGLKLASAEALRRLEECDCSASCHKCLREFWNQRIHHLLNRFEVLAVLRRIAEGHATRSPDPENEQLESFLEVEFFNRLKAAGLPTPTLQVVRDLGSGIITRVDAEYRDPDISIFLDGRAYHTQSLEKIADDLERRNRLEERGVLVLEFTFHDVMARFDDVMDSVRRALREERGDEMLQADLAALSGLKLVGEADASSMLAEFGVDGTSWRKSEEARAASLHSANRLRLAGWRIKRIVVEGDRTL